MAALSVSHHLTQTWHILFSFPFKPNPTQSYWQAQFGNVFSLNWATSHDKLGATFVTSLKTVAVGPEVLAKGRSRLAQRSWAAWADLGKAGISLKGRLYEAPCSVSPHVIIYLSMSLHFDTAMGCPRDMKPSGNGHCSPCWQFGCSHPSHRRPEQPDRAGNSLLCLPPSFPLPPALLYFLM